jgi:hypothetical protein
VINIQQKGGGAEREIATILNGILINLMREMRYDERTILASVNSIQRNSNQTAVGGSDLINTFGLGIEIKRQEDLYINQWWAQCCQQAARNQEWPVLIFRQSRKTWRVVTYGYFPITNKPAHVYRAEMGWIDFHTWFREWVREKLLAGDKVKT